MTTIRNLPGALSGRIRHTWRLWNNQRRERRMATAIADQAQPVPSQKPVVFFNASTRLMGMSINAGYSLLTAWSLRLQGIPVVHFVCGAGMSRCVLGANKDRPDINPPCVACISQSQSMYQGAQVEWFTYQADPALDACLKDLSVSELASFEHGEIPLGKLVLPALRWTLRRHTLADDEPTRFLFRQYILSAWNVAQEFTPLLGKYDPQAVVVFNGTFYPEATVRWVARQRGIRVISHETAFLPFSSFFTPDEATAYPIQIPEGYELSAEQNARLDEYLSQRFQGNFLMGGIRFWPEMKGLDETFLRRMAGYRQMVPVFTNVIFDTSQGHANLLYPDMFAWLDALLEIFRRHPDTLFVVRAHPDESRPGKASRETVRQWAENRKLRELPNVVFIDSSEYVSSYELVQRAAFVLVYNSSIGLEASVLGAAVLCAGKVRYNIEGYPTVILPEGRAAYEKQLETFLQAGKITPPPELQQNARRFYYWQLYRTSLPFDRFLEASGWPGFVRLRRFAWQDLLPENSATLRIVSDGILRDGSFLYDDPLDRPGAQ